ncbi:UrvD/REP family ATP-dependent DNA helicase [Actinotalea sp. K2]|uniref:ATP-dependent helicase n=1 Tax=Actinotalea sp. K2 TaxID=2939438 RepID=UPI0020174A59|nr:UrvD/REP family ATP-dependent DNA helicase [Actinotalea sp. K2]MCL3859860.1 PD-(D/E)XK nuclease family protein [Actinotalea sp. K2]
MPPPLTLSPPLARGGLPTPDADQRRVLAHRGSALLVRGTAGTGKTTTALACVVDRVGREEVEPGQVLLLAPTRRAAARLRDDLSGAMRRTAGQAIVRTPASAAFSVLRSRAALLGEPPPTLISGPEQDLVLADLLAGHAEGEGAPVGWPERVPPAALGLRAFRDELRDLLMRAAERGLRPVDLAGLGRRHGRPEWVAAAAVYEEYLDVTQLRQATPDAGERYDPAAVVDEAVEALRSWEATVPGAPRPRWGLVVVDDYQEATAATARLLHVLADDGAQLVLLGDPDAAVQTFRGATPALVARATATPGAADPAALGAHEVVLGTVWRHGPILHRAVRSVTEEIRTGAGRRHRAATAAAADHGGAPARVAILRSPAQEAAYVAYTLREARLHEGMPWSRMAVVVRSGSQVTELRRALLAAQVPVAVVGSDVPLRAEPAVRPLLLALECALHPADLSAEAAGLLLASPLGGLDAVGVRRLRRALRAEELAGGGGRSSDPLLVEVLDDPARAASLPASVRRPVVRLAGLLAAGRDALGRPGATALDVLWVLWSHAGLAEPWRRSALAGGPAGARADRDLDAVLALFKAAEQFVDRLPQAPVRAFLEHLQSQDLPADSLAAHGESTESVAVLTAAGAAGGEWDLVVVAGVQEGTWPDLRLRDSMLGAQHLVDVMAGRVATDAGAGTDAASGARVVEAAEARAAVLDDELRAFAVAVSRSRRALLVTAVKDTDRQPSALLDLIDPGPEGAAVDPRLTSVPPALDLRAVVAQCRSELEQDAVPGRPAAHLLARLAAEGVPGADPTQWYGAVALSTTAPLWPQERPVPLSPSRLEAASTCALRWALEAAGGTAADSGEQTLGTLVHEIAAALPGGTEDELAALLDQRWSELGLSDGWVGAVQRRRARAMVRHLAAYLKAQGEPVAVEEPFSVQIGRVVLRGSVDRLERVGDTPEGRPLLRVVDLKTGRSAVSKDDAARHAQLGAYQAAVEAGAFEDRFPGAACGGAGLVYVGTTNRSYSERQQDALRQDPDPGWAADLLEHVADTVSRSAVAATRNDLCRVCPVTRSCPVQPEGRGVVG